MRPNTPTSCRRRDTVLLLILARFPSRSSWAISDVVFLTFFVDLRLMILSTRTVVYRGPTDRERSDRHLVVVNFSIILFTVLLPIFNKQQLREIPSLVQKGLSRLLELDSSYVSAY